MGRWTHYTHIRGSTILLLAVYMGKANPGWLALNVSQYSALMPTREVGTGRGLGIYCRICFADALRDWSVAMPSWIDFFEFTFPLQTQMAI
jgi:hypothetical protein